MDKKASPYAIAGASTGVAIATGPQMLHGVTFTAGASGNSLTIYDNASAASGTILVSVTNTAAVTQSIALPNVEAKNGLYAVQTGANSASQIYY